MGGLGAHDELKIQMESPQDLDYLRAEVMRALVKDGKADDPKKTERFLNALFDIVSDNVQIEGMDIKSLPEEKVCKFLISIPASLI
jgi:hypothetical protein